MPESHLPAMIRAFRNQALADATNPISLYGKAFLCRGEGDVAGWQQAVEAAFLLPHETLEQQYARGWAKITLGDWSGWSDYNVRGFLPDESSPDVSIDAWIKWTRRAWDGEEDLDDKIIAIVPEQGVGDNVQMLRYIPVLADLARHVVAITYPRLVPLVQSNFGDRATVWIHGVDKPVAFDRYVLAMSLPALVGGIPPFIPLQPPRRRPNLRPRNGRIRGGLCWAGNPIYPDDENRSMPAAYLEPLVARSDVEWHSLQVGANAIDADRYPTIIRPWPTLFNFAETADCIAELDFVVAVDTAVAHLAGSLGVPTYLLVPSRSDGRWGTSDRTPWYPSMRIVRQQSPGRWSEVIATVQRMLDADLLTTVSHRIPSSYQHADLAAAAL